MAFRDGTVLRLPDEDVLQLPDVRLRDLDGGVAVGRHDFVADVEVVVRRVALLEPSLLAAGRVVAFAALVRWRCSRFDPEVEPGAEPVVLLVGVDLLRCVARSESVVHHFRELGVLSSDDVLLDEGDDLSGELLRRPTCVGSARHVVRELVVCRVGLHLSGCYGDSEALTHELSQRSVAPALDIRRDKFALL